MATRSAIGYVTESGTIMAAYCHWDGYLSHNGQILNSHYTDENKIVELVLGGEISSLGSEIGVKHPFDTYNLSDEEKTKFQNMTTYYGRDRDEINTDHKVFNTIHEFMDHYEGTGAEYFYVYYEGKWIVSQHGKDFELLTEALERDLAQNEPNMKLSDINREKLQRDYADRWIVSASEYDLVDLAWEALMEKLDKMSTKDFVAFVEKHDPEALSLLKQK